MLQFEELMQKLRNQQPELKDLADALGIERMKNEIAELDMRAAEPNFWDDMEKSQKTLQRSSMLKGKLEAYERLCST